MKTISIIIAASALALFAAVGFAHDFSGYPHGGAHMGWNAWPGWHHSESWDGAADGWYGHHRDRHYRGRHDGQYHPCAYGWDQDQRRLPQRLAPRDETR